MTDLDRWRAFLAPLGLRLDRADWGDRDADFYAGHRCVGAQCYVLEGDTAADGGCYASCKVFFRDGAFVGLDLNGG